MSAVEGFDKAAKRVIGESIMHDADLLFVFDSMYDMTGKIADATGLDYDVIEKNLEDLRQDVEECLEKALPEVLEKAFARAAERKEDAGNGE